MGLDQAIALKKDAIAYLQQCLLLLILCSGHEPKGHPPRSQLVGLVVMPPAREVVASVGVDKASALGVENAVEAGDERARGYFRGQTPR